MTNHRKIIFDETKKVQQLLQTGFSNNELSIYELSILAKYYVSIGYSGKKLRNELITFCKKHSMNFNEIIHRQTILDAIFNAQKYKLKVPPSSVVITKKELSIILSIPYKYAKILFVMTVLAKISKQNDLLKNKKRNDNGHNRYFCCYELKKILQITRTYLSPQELINAKHFLDAEKGYISAIRDSRKDWEILIIDESSEPAIIITDLNNIINYFPSFCERCGKTIEKTGRRQKYCEECSILRKLEYNKERNKKMRQML